MAFSRRQSVGAPPEIIVPRLVLILSALALVLIGLVMVYSTTSVDAINEGFANYSYIIRHLAFIVIGVALAAFVYRAIPHYTWAGQLVLTVWIIGMVLLVLVITPLGVEKYGARRWLGIGEFTIQPSEFVKVALLLMTAKILASMRAGDTEGKAAVVQVLIFVAAPAAFLYLTQSDLGTTAIIAIGVLAVLWLADIPLRYILLMVGVGAACLIVAIFGSDYRTGRLVYLDPWNDGAGGYGDGYNIIRSYYAIAEGGIFGVGLGNSHEKYQYLFASESDFIYAIICEELGMLGALLVVALFLVLLFAGLRIAQNAPDDLGRMIAGGCTIMLVFQAFLNIGCVIGVFPTTGKPLPFVSMGGSSMMSSMIMVGLILSVSRASEGVGVYERRRDDLRVVRARDPYASEGYAAGPHYAQSQPYGHQARVHGAQASRAQTYQVYRGSRPAQGGGPSYTRDGGTYYRAHGSSARTFRR